MSVTKDQVAALYAAVFNRAPDQEGLNFWVGQDNFVSIAEGFVAHPVFVAEYAELSNLEFVQSIYENVLNGQGDAEGIDFWVNLLDNGATKGEFLASFLDAALAYEGDDADALLRQQALQNKVEVALYYTEEMGAASNLSPDVDPSSIDVAEDPVYKQSQEILSTVTADAATVAAAKAKIDAIAPRDEGELVEALEDYQDALNVQADAVDAEQAAAKAADEGLNLEIGANADDIYEDITEVQSAVDEEVIDLAQAVREATVVGEAAQLIPDSVAVNASSIALARNNLESTIELAQTQVDLLKQQNKAAVTLQEKIQAYNDLAAGLEEATTELDIAVYGLEQRNEDITLEDPIVISGADTKQGFAVKLTDDITVGVVKGEVVAGTVDDTGDEDKFVASNAAAQVALNELAGVESLKAAVKALYDNVQAVQSAETAIDNATIAALKAAGYKVYDADKVVAWSSVKVESGKLVKADDADLRTLVTKVEGNTNYPELSIGDTLLTVDSITETATIADPAAEIADGDKLFNTPIANAAGESADAVATLAAAKGTLEGFEEALVEYEAAVKLQAALEAATSDVEDATDAVAEAIELFEDLGVNLVVAEDGVAIGEVYNENAADQEPDLFVYATSLTEVDNFDGPEDVIYFGDKAVALVQLDADFDVATGKLGGDNNVLEIFALQENDNTVLYVEKAAFAGNSANAIGSNDDLVKITLTGVQADELQLSADGFLGFIA